MKINNSINLAGVHQLFSVYVSADVFNVTGNGLAAKIPASATIYNTGYWNTSSYTFTAPYNGLYCFNGCLTTTGYSGTHTQYQVYAYSPYFETIFSSCTPYACRNSDTLQLSHSFAQTYYMNKGYTVTFYVQVTGGSKYVDIKGGYQNSNISGFYIG